VKVSALASVESGYLSVILRSPHRRFHIPLGGGAEDEDRVFDSLSVSLTVRDTRGFSLSDQGRGRVKGGHLARPGV